MKSAIIFLFILLFANSENLFAQPYKSMFGSGHTSWVISWQNISVAGRDSMWIEKDTAVHGIAYKKVTSMQRFYLGGLIREDLDSGKVMYKALGYSPDFSADTQEVVLCRFDLQEGDTFDISNQYLGMKGEYPDSLDVVDSVRYHNGLKYIYFRGRFTGRGFDEPITFIESVGPNLGISYKQHSWSYMQVRYLLCSYQDGVQTPYRNLVYEGSCELPLAIDEVGKMSSSICFYPNPARDFVQVTNASGKVISVQIMGPDGRVYKERSSMGDMRISLQGMPSGCYLLRLSGKGYGSVKRLTVL